MWDRVCYTPITFKSFFFCPTLPHLLFPSFEFFFVYQTTIVQVKFQIGNEVKILFSCWALGCCCTCFGDMVDLPPFRKCLALCIHFVQMETVCRAQTIQALKMPRFHPYFLQMSKIKFKKQVKKKWTTTALVNQIVRYINPASMCIDATSAFVCRTNCWGQKKKQSLFHVRKTFVR